MTRVPSALLALTLLAAGCTAGQEEDAAAPSESPVVGHYAALGDSFTAAPYVPTTDLADGCLRSDGNYPALVAAALPAGELTDVSCSGADTDDLHRPQRTYRDTTVPAQLEAVRPDTGLVTVGIGGNDLGLYDTLVRGCTGQAAVAPQVPCREAVAGAGGVAGAVAVIERRVVRALRAVRRRAPDAQVLLVGYPRLAPEAGTCPELGMDAEDVPFAAGVVRALNDGLRRAARRAEVGFVDLHAASRGHDICADEPWVNGRTTDRSAALAFHPLPAGMRAVADLVLARVRSAPR